MGFEGGVARVFWEWGIGEREGCCEGGRKTLGLGSDFRSCEAGGLGE